MKENATGDGARRDALRPYLMPSRRFYEIADLTIAKRLGGVLWAAGGALGLVLLPLSPPTHAFGNAGWLVAGALLVVCGVLGARLFRAADRVGPDELLVSSFVAIGIIALFKWLAGPASPYDELLLLSVVFTCAVHPPRRVLPYLGTVVAVDLAPLAWAGSSRPRVAESIVSLVLWIGLGLVATVFTSRLRLQRMDLREEGDRARELARLDPLTGLGNRRAFDEALADAVLSAQRSDEPLSVVVADLDGFKAINDRHGHLEGDRCLREVADAVRAHVRSPDLCFRWGGDEFALVLPRAGEDEADGVCARLGAAIAAECAGPDGEPVRVTHGRAQLQSGMQASDLLAAADAALLAAKPAAGRAA